MELEVYKISGEKAGKKVKLNDAIFGIEPNDHAIYLDVKQHMANKRQGTHSSKERSQLSGSSRKIKKQKGTGTARMGDIKSPLLRGGARAFGPHPRDYSFKLNKKVKQLARKSAFTYMAKDKKITIVEDFNFDAPRTKDYIDFLNNFDLSDKKSLLVLIEPNKNVYLSTRNLKGAKITIASSLNTYEILNAKNLLLSESSIAEIERIHIK